MLSYSIGLDGLNAAQKALDLIGTNISNATTEGYHKQELQLAPVDYASFGAQSSGGVQVVGIRRLSDGLLETQLTNQQSTLGQSTEELGILQAIEGALGDLDSSNIGDSLEQFLSSMTQLASQPNSLPLREQMAQAADNFCSQLRTFSDFLSTLKEQVYAKAQLSSQEVNNLCSQIADLNGQVIGAIDRGGSPNVLQDQRDQAIKDLANILAVHTDTNSATAGAVNVTSQGTALVMDTMAGKITVEQVGTDAIGIDVNDSCDYQTDWQGGTLGAMLNLRNVVIPQICRQLDTLAQQVMTAVNQIHIQGVGMDGSFTSLTGVLQPGGLLSSWDAPVQSGQVHIRITDSSGDVVRQTVQINPDIDTLASVAGKIGALDGISASVVSGALRIQADTGYKFDFLPTAILEPDSSNITGSARPTVGGIYDGLANDVFTCTAKGSGEVGNSASLNLEVRNQAGELVDAFNIGTGYAAGDQLQLPNGLKIAMSLGQLNDGDSFTIEGLANTDTSGFLAAAGINTFFIGSSARDIAVAPGILADSNKIACACGAGGADNTNIYRMSGLAEKVLDAFGRSTAVDYFNRIVTGVGQLVSDRQARQKSTQDVMQNMQQQRDSISGVDVNTEAANLMIYSRMYQGMAKFLTTQDQSLKYLLELI